MMKETVHNLECALMPHFRVIREGLSEEFPEVEHQVYSNSGGDLTPHPWHVMGVSCLLHRDWDNPPNEVMIQVSVTSIKSQIMLEAYVMWDYILTAVNDLFPRPVPISAEAITEVEKRLPELLEVLKVEVRRGKPPAGSAGTET
jgi:hypothetical protein